jgi:hypothetical protein
MPLLFLLFAIVATATCRQAFFLPDVLIDMSLATMIDVVFETAFDTSSGSTARIVNRTA